MTATLTLPKSTALGMLAKAQDGNQLLQILDAIIDTHEDQVPVVDVNEDEVSAPDESYIMDNDYNDDIDF